MRYKSLHEVFIQLVQSNKVPCVVPVQQIKVQSESTAQGREAQWEESWLARAEGGRVKSNRKGYFIFYFSGHVAR